MFWQRLKYEWKNQWSFKLATGYLLLLMVCVLFAPFLTFGISPNMLDLLQTYQAPFGLGMPAGSTLHWLGTDQLGRDVWANLLYGGRTAFLVAIPVMLLAMLLGTAAGLAAAWFGNRGLRVTYASLLSIVFGCFAAWFYLGYLQTGASSGWLQLTGIVIVVWFLSRLLKILPLLIRKIDLPFDEILLKIMEIMASVPRLILVIGLAVLLKPGMGNVILLLSLTYWIGVARLVRAETLKIKALPYVEAALASGLPVWRIWLRYVLPNAAAPLTVFFCFGLSGLLGLEATLSFLGIGLPPETPGWGRMLAGARLNPEAWWLICFPSFLLCLTILAIQAIGQALRNILFLNR